MKLVHTSYILTTIIFVVLASFLLVREPNMKKDVNEVEQNQPIKVEKPIAEPKPVDQIDLLGHLPKVEVTATGYYAGVESTGKGENHPQYGITYSGVKAKRDVYSTIAADLNVFPLGTILFIPGYGYGVVADIGSAIKGNKIDLYFNTLQDVYKKWGKKTLDVYVVKKGEGVVTEAMLQELNSKQLVQANSLAN